jgi:rubredoxin
MSSSFSCKTCGFGFAAGQGAPILPNLEGIGVRAECPSCHFEVYACLLCGKSFSEFRRFRQHQSSDGHVQAVTRFEEQRHHQQQQNAVDDDSDGVMMMLDDDDDDI